MQNHASEIVEEALFQKNSCFAHVCFWMETVIVYTIVTENICFDHLFTELTDYANSLKIEAVIK